MNQPATMGAAASAAWTEQHGLEVWYVEISIPTDTEDTRLELNIYPEEWGVIFRRGNRVSSIRVTDIAFVHGHDDYRLLHEVPSLDRIDDLLALLERRHDIAFQRIWTTVRSNLIGAPSIVRSWLVGPR